MSALAKIHIAKKQLGLDEDTYRERLRFITGKSSAREMSEDERNAVLDSFYKDGFKFISKGKKATFTGPSTKLAAKIHALWLSGWNLGVIRDPSDAAMEAFILRQTSIAKAQWLKDARDGAKVIDALKAWLAREGRVKWTSHRDASNAVLFAQADILESLGQPVCHISGDPILCQKENGRLIRNAQEANRAP